MSANTEYRAQLRFNTTRTVQQRAARVVNNTETQLGSLVTVPGVTHTANGFVWLRVQATGANPTTLCLKAWADGQTVTCALEQRANQSHWLAYVYIRLSTSWHVMYHYVLTTLRALWDATLALAFARATDNIVLTEQHS